MTRWQHHLVSRALRAHGSGRSMLSDLLHRAAMEVVRLWFGAVVRFVATMDVSTIRRVWWVVSASTEPVLSGSAWHAEFSTMAVIAATAMLPLLFAAAIQAVARQDAGGLARTAFVRVPLALLFTAVAVELVSLGLRATDEACASLMSTAGRPLHHLLVTMTAVMVGPNVFSLASNFLLLLLAGFLGFVVWIELAVRSAAVAVATLFLPLALAGTALPATAHWARRLGETLTALVLSKLAIVAVLTLAVGTLGDRRGGFPSIVEGITLLGLAAVAPLALAKILPMVEGGAVAHLEGLGRHSLRTVSNATGSPTSWMTSARAMGGDSEGASGMAGAGFGGVGARQRSEPPNRPMSLPPPARPAPNGAGAGDG